MAKAIIFKRAEKVARTLQLPAYRANAVAYTVSLISYRTAGRVDLAGVWDQQECPQVIADTMWEWMQIIHKELMESAGTRNVTEWCKQEACWRHIQMLDLDVPAELEAVLAAGQPLPTVGDQAERKGDGLTTEDRENIARVMQVSAEAWVKLSGWGARSGHLPAWQVGIATTLAAYAAAEWTKVPSKKQAKQGVEILRIADAEQGWEGAE